MKTIPLSVPHIGGNAWRYVKSCLDSGWVSSAGPFVSRFEAAVAKYTGSPHAVAAVNGTAALHVALQAAGVRPGDKVAVPALTFIATANAVTYAGARPVFVDCELDRLNMDPGALERVLARQKIRAVVPVHVLGYPCDMRALLAAARRHGAAVVEDAAESIGSFYQGRHTGAIAPLGVLSFNGNKIVTAGGGGMILTPSSALAKRLRHVTQQAKASAVEYVHDVIGYNYRLTNVAAALGVSQLELLPELLRRRRLLGGWYRAGLPGVPAPNDGEGIVWNRWLMAVRVGSPAEKSRLLKALDQAGCQARPLWVPVPDQRPYRGAAGRFPNARRAYDTIVNIPSSASVTRADAERVCRVLRKFPLEELLA